MKTICLLSAFISLSLSSFTQTSDVRLYGFRQTVLSGTHETNQTDEQGKEIKAEEKIYNTTFIYFSYPPNEALYPVEIWMNGSQYSVKTKPVTTPVEMAYDNGTDNPDRVILIPYTTDTVVQLMLSDKLPSKTNGIKKSLAETNDLVIVYKKNGKLYSQTLKKIKGLRTIAMQ